MALGSLVAQVVVQRPSYMELRKQQESAAADSAAKSAALDKSLNVLLRKIAEHCDISSNSDRASVYYFHQERFIMLARWSIHPTYNEHGRGEYPAGQGAIGDAWDRRSVVTILPATRARWVNALVGKHNFSAEATASLSMQCQSIAALRIETEHHAVGVMVFESLDPARASQATLTKAADSMLFATMCELVGAVATLTPRVEELEKAVAVAKKSPAWKPNPTV